MVKVSVDAAGLRLVVLAESIGRARALVEDLYPGAQARVVFPLDPEGFFAGPGAGAGVERAIPDNVAS